MGTSLAHRHGTRTTVRTRRARGCGCIQAIVGAEDQGRFGPFPTTPVLFGFLAIVFGPEVFCDAWFHIGGTVLSRTYCPVGDHQRMVSLPLSLMVVVSGMRDGLCTPRFLLAALAVAAIFRTLEKSITTSSGGSACSVLVFSTTRSFSTPNAGHFPRPHGGERLVRSRYQRHQEWLRRS